MGADFNHLIVSGKGGVLMEIIALEEERRLGSLSFKISKGSDHFVYLLYYIFENASSTNI